MSDVPPFYSVPGLNVETTAERWADLDGTPVVGDIEFYVAMGTVCGGPVLEIGCGSGRVTIPLARAGLEVVGLDLSGPMLDVAHRRLAAEDAAVAARVTLQRGDMVDFDLGRTLPLVVVPFRAFQALLEPGDQRRALACLRSHLRPGGRLVIDQFDPLLPLVSDAECDGVVQRSEFGHPQRGTTVRCEVVGRVNDRVRQVFRETWRFTELDAAGAVLRVEHESLALRWSYRYEMRHLFELCGLRVVAETSDFHGSPPAYGREQVWVLARDTDVQDA